MTETSTGLRPVVLIVEDNDDTRDLYQQWLSFHGLRVVVASTGEDALKQAQNVMPDLVMLDILLGGNLDGCQVARLLKTQLPDRVPVIAVTALAMAEDVRRAQGAGCDAVFAKPIEPETLLAEIRRLLHRPAVPEPPKPSAA
jgi:CheY-like chemotaxis protein